MSEDVNYYELFGLEEPTQEPETGAASDETPEVVTPEPQTEEPREQEQAAATPAVGADEPDESEKDGEPAAAAGDGEAKKPAQTPEENARYAAARRAAERERDERIAQIRAENDREWTDFFARAKLVNSINGQPIRNREEFKAWADAFEKSQTAEIRKKTGMSEDEFKAFIESSPDVRALREREAEARAQMDEIRMQKQLEEITAIDPKIKTWGDLRDDPKFEAIRERVRSTRMSIADAYRLEHQQELIERAAAHAARGAQDSAAGKAHMAATQLRGKAEDDVPADVVEQYRLFNPDATMDEIRKHYHKYHK